MVLLAMRAAAALALAVAASDIAAVLARLLERWTWSWSAVAVAAGSVEGRDAGERRLRRDVVVGAATAKVPPVDVFLDEDEAALCLRFFDAMGFVWE